MAELNRLSDLPPTPTIVQALQVVAALSDRGELTGDHIRLISRDVTDPMTFIRAVDALAREGEITIRERPDQ